MKSKIIFGIGLVIMTCNSCKKKMSETMNESKTLIVQNVLSISEFEEPFLNYLNPSSEAMGYGNILPIRKLDSTLVKKIVSMALSGKIKVYEKYTDTVALSIENIKLKIKPKQVDGFLVNIKTHKSTPITDTVYPIDDIFEIRFKEDWILNPSNANISKKILGYGLYRAVDSTGELQTVKVESIFWVKTNDQLRH